MPHDVWAGDPFLEAMPKDAPWTIEQVTYAMRRMAVLWAPKWAESMFARILDSRMVASLAIEEGSATRDEGNKAIEGLYQTLAIEIGQTFDRIADDLEMTARADREAFAIECHEAMQARWTEMVAGTPMGQSGRA